MSRVLLLYLIILASAAQAQTNAVFYQLDRQASKIEWTGSLAYDVVSHQGTIMAHSGSIMLRGDQINAALVVMDMKTIAYADFDLLQELESPDFFDVEKFPTATFTLLEPIKGAGTQDAKGTMLIKDQAQTETVQLEVVQSDGLISVSFSMPIDRTKYGITAKSPSFFKLLKDEAIADMFTIDARLVFNRISN